jgi:hypothetical protein
VIGRTSSLAERLRTFPSDTSLQDAVAVIRWTDVRVRARAPRLFEEPPDMPDRVRGALGRALERLAAPHRADPWLEPVPTAWDLLFSPEQIDGGPDSSRPYVIRTDRIANEIEVVVRLFGVAGALAGEIRTALLDAFARGLAIRPGGRMDVRLEPVEQSVTSFNGLAPGLAPSVARLRFDTPLAVRSGSALRINARSIEEAFHRRAAGVLRWHGVSLAVLKRELDWRLEVIAAPMTDWRRRSSTPTSRGMPMRGVMAHILIDAPAEETWLLLVLGELFHVGGMTPLGFGRFHILRA